MSYPTLPSSSYLQALHHSSTSASPSSTGPVTPELAHTQPHRVSDVGDDTRRVSGAESDGSAGDESIRCKWADCRHYATGPEELYDHLCQAHVGRKSTGNLCLTCGWEGCGVKCVKRDHITSHLRVHTPLKPHPCAVCGKTFKRPQDLKKHERIHTQEHHQLHKLSKATTTADPLFNTRVAPSSDRRQSIPDDRHRSSLSQSLSPSSASSQSHLAPSSPFDRLLPPAHQHPAHKSVSPTPSALAALHKKQHEELAAYQQREMLVLQQLAYQQQQSQAYAAQLATETVPQGSKRGMEDTFEGLWDDLKKRKVEPIYDADMMHRLNSLGSLIPSTLSQLPPLPSNPFAMPTVNSDYSLPPLPAFNGLAMQNPPALPLPQINTDADLAMFNEFMLSLGRDAAMGTGSGPMPTHFTQPAPIPHLPSFESSRKGSGASGSPLSDQSPIEDLFNPEELAHLGLAGMPGIPAVSQIQFGGLYPSLDNVRTRPVSASDVNDVSKRAIACLPRANSTASNFFGKFDFSPIPTAMAPQSFQMPELSHDFSFDSLARSKQAAPATLAPRDFYKKTYRHVAPLGTAVSARTAESAERTSVHEVDEPEEMDTPKIPLRSLLARPSSEDDLTLPAITHPDVENVRRTRLPSLHEALPPLFDAVARRGSTTGSGLVRPPVKRHTEDEITHGVKRLELSDGARGEAPSPSPAPEERRGGRSGVVMAGRDEMKETRRRHAALIRAWLVAVNLEYRKRRLGEVERNAGRLRTEMDDEADDEEEETEGEDEREAEDDVRGVRSREDLMAAY